MAVIWLNGTVGAGKSAVGQALARLLPTAVFVDGDDLAGPPDLPDTIRWQMALQALLRAAIRRGHARTLVVAYPLDTAGHRQLRAACGRARRRLVVVTLAPPLPMTLRGRGGRELDSWERARVREMRSQGYHRRPFADVTLPNVQPPAAKTGRQIARLLRHPRRSS